MERDWWLWRDEGSLHGRDVQRWRGSSKMTEIFILTKAASPMFLCAYPGVRGPGAHVSGTNTKAYL